jgi:hypothetical protein
MDVGDEVDVLTHYNDTWSPGFNVVDIVAGGYLVRRRSDGGVLPVVIAAADVRAVSHIRTETPSLGPVFTRF